MRLSLKMNVSIQLPDGARLRPRGQDTPTGLTLCDLTPGSAACVVAVTGKREVRRRLLEMGFVSGTRVRVVRVAPLGDPMEVELHGYHLSLRRSEACTILVDAS